MFWVFFLFGNQEFFYMIAFFSKFCFCVLNKALGFDFLQMLQFSLSQLSSRHTSARLRHIVTDCWTLSSGDNFREVYVQKPRLTSSFQSNVDSVCVQGSLAITNNSRSHGCSQLVLCQLPLTFPSSDRKTHQGLMIYAIYLLSFINAILQMSK